MNPSLLLRHLLRPARGAGPGAAALLLGLFSATGQAAQYGGYNDDTGSIRRDPDFLNNSIHGPLSPRESLVPKVIFFPPNAPPLGAIIDFSEAPHSVSLAPDEMAPYVGEPFYAPLSTFISPVITGYQGGDGLLPEEAARLDRFQHLRNELLKELQDTIDRVFSLPAEERRRRLAALARAQAGSLKRLEALAEDLRERLARRADWNQFRAWRLGQSEISNQPGAYYSFQIQVVRAAAFYEEGLSPAQRRLLRELQLEMEEKARLEEGTVATSRLYDFFLPETARVRFPKPLPAPLESRVHRFLQEKDALKKELGDAVVSRDDQPGPARHAALRRLAQAQEPRFAALEDLADEIRDGMATAPGFARWPRPRPIPDDLLQRIVRLQLRYRELWRGPAPPEPAAVRNLEQELDQLHRTLELATQSPIDRPNVAEADAFLTKFLRSEQQKRAYYDYDWAVWEPGLSPAQRRLLFRAALADLGLPLPGAETQPTLIGQP